MSKENISIDKLADNLDNDYAWRQKELVIFSNHIPTVESPKQTVYLRAGVTLVYAHWEGFIGCVTKSYLQHISLQSLNHNELKSPFIALCIKKHLNNMDSNKIGIHVKTIDFLLEELNKRSNIPYDSEIKTRSNLNFNVFKEILFLISFNPSPYYQYESLINDLVNIRNNIAHGKRVMVDYSLYLRFNNEILNLMRNIKTELLNAAINKLYKRSN